MSEADIDPKDEFIERAKVDINKSRTPKFNKQPTAISLPNVENDDSQSETGYSTRINNRKRQSSPARDNLPSLLPSTTPVKKRKEPRGATKRFEPNIGSNRISKSQLYSTTNVQRKQSVSTRQGDALAGSKNFKPLTFAKKPSNEPENPHVVSDASTDNESMTADRTTKHTLSSRNDVPLQKLLDAKDRSKGKETERDSDDSDDFDAATSNSWLRSPKKTQFSLKKPTTNNGGSTPLTRIERSHLRVLGGFSTRSQPNKQRLETIMSPVSNKRNVVSRLLPQQPKSNTTPESTTDEKNNRLQTISHRYSSPVSRRATAKLYDGDFTEAPNQKRIRTHRRETYTPLSPASAFNLNSTTKLGSSKTRQPHSRATRRQTMHGSPAHPRSIPPRTVALSGIRIGKFVQIGDPLQAKAKQLKITISSVRNMIDITGLSADGGEMKIYTNEIASFEYGEQDDIILVRLLPDPTMESVFEESIFNPASDDPELKTLYFCWLAHKRDDRSRLGLIKDLFSSQLTNSKKLPIPEFTKYSTELTKPHSIDLVTSSENEADLAKPPSKQSACDNSDSYTLTNTSSASVAAARISKFMKELTNHGEEAANEVAPRRGWYPSVLDEPVSEAKKPRSAELLKGLGVRPPTRVGLRGRQILNNSIYKDYSSSSSSADDDNDNNDIIPFEDKTMLCNINDDTLAFSYPAGERNAIRVTHSDIYRLYPNEFLNDTIIEFYLRYISEKLRNENPTMFEGCFFFNPFFFKKLSSRQNRIFATSNSESMKAVYNQLKKWTANVDIFDKKYIFVPINERLHWYLAIITNPRLLFSKDADDLKPVSSVHKVSSPKCNPLNNYFCVSPKSRVGSSFDNTEQKDTDEQEKMAVNTKEDGNTSRNEPNNDNNDTVLAEDSDTESKEPSHIANSASLLDNISGVNAANHDNECNSRLETPEAKAISSNIPKEQTLANDACERSPREAPSTPIKHCQQDRESGLNNAAKQRNQESDTVIDLISPQRELPNDVLSEYFSKPVGSEMVEMRFKDKTVRVSASKYRNSAITPSIMILDSLGGKHQGTFALLRSYLASEAKFRHKEDLEKTMLGKYAKVPLQDNLCDCGIFVLQYVEEFLKDPESFLEAAINGIDMRSVWFDSELVKKKRHDILALTRSMTDTHLKKDDKNKDCAFADIVGVEPSADNRHPSGSTTGSGQSEIERSVQMTPEVDTIDRDAEDNFAASGTAILRENVAYSLSPDLGESVDAVSKG